MAKNTKVKAVKKAKKVNVEMETFWIGFYNNNDDCDTTLVTEASDINRSSSSYEWIEISRPKAKVDSKKVIASITLK